jgi:hypothetical protein
MRTSRMLSGVFGLVLTLAVSPAAFAQAQYDASALRVKAGFWSTKLVAGADEHKVCSLGSFPSRAPADLMQERSPEAANLYLTYRRRQTAGELLTWAGALMSLGAVFAADSNGASRDGVVIGLLAGTAVCEIAGIVIVVYAKDYLSRAVWTYNRTLALPERSSQP